MSYQVSTEGAVKNAGRLVKEAGVEAVKLEGGQEAVEAIEKIVAAGIPVMGHLGLTPQSINKLGGYGVRGEGEEEAKQIIADAKALETAGIFALVLEKVPARLAKEITGMLSVPTIGIGAGVDCDGQVLVTHDMLGFFEKFKPKFAKRYMDLAGQMKNCYRLYIEEVKQEKFPGQEHSY
jgi:3-methyl-2-oxobutanoate hydroxymethyltransferase